MPIPIPVATFHDAVYPAIEPTNPASSQAGKVVVVSGAGGAIGRAIAVAFAAAGAAHIVLLGRTRSTLEATRAAIPAASAAKVHVYTGDVADEARTEAVFAEVAASLGPIDAVIANAGYLAYGPFAQMAVADFRTALEANATGAFIAAQAFLRHKTDKPHATFVLVNTAAAHLPPQMPSTGYIASKAAAARVIEALQAEHPEVRAFNLHPGMVRSAMSDKAGMSAVSNDTPELPAAMCVWLCGPRADWLKGRFFWANWDVEEMEKEYRDQVEAQPDYLQMGLIGWPFRGQSKKAPWE